MISPFLAFRPSRRQKHIAALREEARRCGLRVQIVPEATADQNDRSPVAVRYLLPWLAKTTGQTDFAHWVLVRNYSRGQPSSWPDWRWFKNEAPGNQRQAIAKGLSVLPGEVSGLSGDGQGLSIYWQERGGVEQVQIIAEALLTIRQAISELSQDLG